MQATAISATFYHITQRKLKNLKEQSDHYAMQKDEIHLLIEKNGSTPVEKLDVLVNALEDHDLVKDVKRHCIGAIDFDAVKQAVAQAKQDPTFPSSILLSYKEKLLASLEAILLQYQHGLFYGELVVDWIDSSARPCKRKSAPQDTQNDFEELKHGQMYEQQQEWEKRAFSNPKMDAKALEAILDRAFEHANVPVKIKNRSTRAYEASSPMERMREANAAFRANGHTLQMTASDVLDCIAGILNQDLYSGMRRRELAELKTPEMLGEIANVINQDLKLLHKWQWENEPIKIHMRRATNAKYRFFMDEDFHQAILIHFLGVEISKHLRNTFKEFFADAWIHSPKREISDSERERLEKTVPSLVAKGCNTIAGYRTARFSQDFWQVNLPTSLRGGKAESYDDSDDESSDNESGNTSSIQQSILRLVTTEMHLSLDLYGTFAVLQSDFKWFGPSLPHETALTIFRYLGFGSDWLHFLEKFLRPSVCFAQEDGKMGTIRSCGVPISHVLSTVIGEALFFCLDTAVNTATHGGYLYRIHDDLWFWGQEEQCQAAWEVIVSFADAAGLQLNESKTGSAVIDSRKGRSADHSSAHLPRGDVYWGFLKLDGTSRGWTAELDALNVHIDQFKTQLAAIPSVLGKARAWNTYVDGFLARNLGEPAKCLGRQHASMCLQTLAKIQERIFGDEDANGSDKSGVNTFMRRLVEKKMPAGRLPESFFFFPDEVGGLGIRNPAFRFADALSSHDFSPSSLLEQIRFEESFYYEKDKESWASRRNKLLSAELKGLKFPSLKEASAFREETSERLLAAYKKLMLDTETSNISTDALSHFRKDGLLPKWTTTNYWRKVLLYYGEECMVQFGDLELARPRDLPLGAMSILKSERMRWQE